MQHAKIVVILVIVGMAEFLVILETEVGVQDSQIQLQRIMTSLVT